MPIPPSSSGQQTVVPAVTQMTHLKKRRMKSVIWRAEYCASCCATSGVNLWPLFAGRGSNKCAAVLWVALCEIRGTLLNFMASSRKRGEQSCVKWTSNTPGLNKALMSDKTHWDVFLEMGGLVSSPATSLIFQNIWCSLTCLNTALGGSWNIAGVIYLSF